MSAFAVCLYLRSPSPVFLANPFILLAILRLRILLILAIGARPKICFSVVQRIAVYMVNHWHIAFQQNLMHIRLAMTASRIYLAA